MTFSHSEKSSLPPGGFSFCLAIYIFHKNLKKILSDYYQRASTEICIITKKIDYSEVLTFMAFFDKDLVFFMEYFHCALGFVGKNKMFC